MGRFYNGDIEGKFWFAVQSSDAPSQFGVEPTEPNYLEYYFEKEHLPLVEKRIEELCTELGEYKDELDKFFQNRDSYTDKKISENLKIPMEKVRTILVAYADLKLGKKIQKCLIEYGSCNFEAEC